MNDYCVIDRTAEALAKMTHNISELLVKTVESRTLICQMSDNRRRRNVQGHPFQLYAAVMQITIDINQCISELTFSSNAYV